MFDGVLTDSRYDEEKYPGHALSPTFKTEFNGRKGLSIPGDR